MAHDIRSIRYWLNVESSRAGREAMNKPNVKIGHIVFCLIMAFLFVDFAAFDGFILVAGLVFINTLKLFQPNYGTGLHQKQMG